MFDVTSNKMGNIVNEQGMKTKFRKIRDHTYARHEKQLKEYQGST